jgi:hypothetical protein
MVVIPFRDKGSGFRPKNDTLQLSVANKLGHRDTEKPFSKKPATMPVPFEGCERGKMFDPS